MENINLFSINALWGNYSFDYAFSPSVGYSGGVLCVWDSNMFVKDSVTIYDSFVAIRGANAFNYFISMARLVDLPLEGYSYTWSHKSASKMSKLDRFLISEGLLSVFPPLSAICLDRHLSDHRPILMRELDVDYGPTPFRIFHSWFSKSGFDKLVEEMWKNSTFLKPNNIILLKKNFQALKAAIKNWCKEDKQRSNASRSSIQSRLSELDKLLDQGKGSDGLVNERSMLLKELQDFNASSSLDMAQKEKIRWSIEGDENSKYFHGIINRNRSQPAIRGVLVEGDWIDEPLIVKNEFFNHFANRMRTLKEMSYDEIKCAVWDCGSNKYLGTDGFAAWDCGSNKSPGPDGFTFEFYRRYWKLIDQDVANDVFEFFSSGTFPPGSNSSFITLIPKMQDAKVIKDFHPISIIGSVYKIITKILANRLSLVILDLISDVQSAFVSNRQILDGPFIINELISSCKFKKTKAMIFKLNGEIGFKGVSILPWGLFSLMAIRHHNSNSTKGIQIDDSLTLSHLLYADDAVFIGKWDKSNINTLVNVLNCFFLASGLKINLHKSKLMGIRIPQEDVFMAANSIGCTTLTASFNYLGVKIWRFISNDSSLWYCCIKAIYGDCGALGNQSILARHSPWIIIIREFESLSSKGELHVEVQKKSNFIFLPIKLLPLSCLVSTTNGFRLSIPRVISRLGRLALILMILCCQRLPKRLSLSLRGIDIQSILCPICSFAGESSSHFLFSCNVARHLLLKVARW
ncbi:RNA-directed DNA polymerase, eukaryota [Tanacetum coccineum]